MKGRRWGCSFPQGGLQLWLRLGPFSLWVDTPSNRLELNGRSLFGWVGRRDPLDALRGLALGIPEGTDPHLATFLHARARPPVLSGVGGALALTLGLGLAWGARGGGPGFLVLGAAWVALGASLRGLAGLAHGAGSLLFLALAGVPPLLHAAASLAFLVAQGMRLRRGVAPFLALWALSPAHPAPWVAWGLVAAIGAFLALRSRSWVLHLGAEETWRYRCQAQSIWGLEDATLWTLHPGDATGLPPEPGFRALSRWRADGRTPVAALGDETQQWILLPGAILVVQEGVAARLHAWSELRLEGRPCTWEARPPGLPEEAWMLRLSLNGDAMALLFGEGEAGRAFQRQWAAWAPLGADAFPAPMHGEGPVFRALTLLGLRPGATWAQIRSAYRREVRRCHPDHHPRASESERQALEARMRALNEGMELLEGLP